MGGCKPNLLTWCPPNDPRSASVANLKLGEVTISQGSTAPRVTARPRRACATPEAVRTHSHGPQFTWSVGRSPPYDPDRSIPSTEPEGEEAVTGGLIERSGTSRSRRSGFQIG